MKNLIVVAIVSLMVVVFSVSCAGNKEIKLAKAHLINQYADYPRTFEKDFNLVGHLKHGSGSNHSTAVYYQCTQEAAFNRHLDVREQKNVWK